METNLKNKSKLLMEKQMDIFSTPRFNGSDYSPKFDNQRLKCQIKTIYTLMIDGKWRTLGEIEELTSYGQASISAQLRHLRKDRFGSHIVNKRNRGEREKGLFEYQLINPDTNGDNLPKQELHIDKQISVQSKKDRINNALNAFRELYKNKNTANDADWKEVADLIKSI